MQNFTPFETIDEGDADRMIRQYFHNRYSEAFCRGFWQGLSGALYIAFPNIETNVLGDDETTTTINQQPHVIAYVRERHA